MRICPICGNAFEERVSCHEKVYCSKKCQSRGLSIRAAARRKAARHAARQIKVCPECGKEFLQTNGNKVYCSKRCGNKASHRACRERMVASGWTSREKKIVQCPRRTVSSPRHSATREMLAKVRAYLALPASDRWARRNELSREELKLAERLFSELTHSDPRDSGCRARYS